MDASKTVAVADLRAIRCYLTALEGITYAHGATTPNGVAEAIARVFDDIGDAAWAPEGDGDAVLRRG